MSNFQKALDQMQKQQVNRGSKTDYLKLQEGEAVILRILPGVGGMEFYWQNVGRHYMSSSESTICPQFTSEEEVECALCELHKVAHQKREKDIPKSLSVRRSFHINILLRHNVYDDPQDDGRRPVIRSYYSGPMVWTPGIMVFQDALTAFAMDVDIGEFWNPETGFDLKLKRAGSGIETKYTLLPKPSPSPIFTEGFDFELNEDGEMLGDVPANLEKVMEQAIDLSTIRERLPTNDDLLAKIGLEETEDDDAW